jgi:hypothetical protein
MAETMIRGVRLATLSLVQGIVLDRAGIQGEVKQAADVALALISDAAIEHVKRRPPSAFLDEVIQPAVQGDVDSSEVGS